MAKKSAKKIFRKSSPPKKSNPKKPVESDPAGLIETDVEKSEVADFPIIGIGASAGGLEAFEKFFSKMPADCGMAFVLVSHFAPTYKSMMPDLLKKYTEMDVYQVEDGMEVRPNTVYVIPPNKDIILQKGTLLLMEPFMSRGIRHPIDAFFRSLADDQKERSICIVLSGTGTEGTLGLQAVKAEGGFVIVQAPESAVYDGMPRSAIATGLADLILSPENMPDELLKYAGRSLKVARKRPEEALGLLPDYLNKIFALIKEKTGHDFSDYKQSTIKRRIEKRMFIHNVERVQDYIRFLQQNPDEVRALFREFLIVVTKFFRDPEAFEILKEKVLPELLEDRPSDQPVRVWVVGCSTGEEAHSIAMLFREYMDENMKNYSVQIFATDMDGDSIEKARFGVFPESIAVDVSQERLKRFFIKEKNTYKIKKEIREMIVFSVQNVIKDPPFSKLDLISCRNLLIYMNPRLQRKVFPIFHYALNKDAFLFLGNSETVGESVDLFSTVDRQWKIYKRKGEVSALHRGMDLAVPAAEYALRQAGRAIQPKGYAERMPELIEKLLLDLYAPPCVIINERAEIRYFHGRTGKYLEPAPGEAKFNILEMAREGLKPTLYRAIVDAQKQKKDIFYKDIQVKSDGDYQMINLTVKSLREPDSLREWMVVIFEEVVTPEAEQEEKITYKPKEAKKRISELEMELKSTKESLQISIEELETSNEEFKSTNEELQSSNEELQSSNEELETSREELQSLNEELSTVNSELQDKIQELSQANNDMNNLLASIEIATVFLDNDLRIKRFTPAAAELINLIQSDIGRPLSNISTNLVYDDLVNDIKEVLRTLIPKEKELQDKKEALYLTRILPYRTVENVTEGAVLTFIDISEVTKLKTSEETEKRARVYAEAIVNTVREPLIVLDAQMHVVTANTSFYKTFQVTKEDTQGSLIYDLGNRQWDIPKLKELLEKILPEKASFDNFEVEHDFPDIGHRKMLLNARRITQPVDETLMILLAIEDVAGK
jgi:two-component system CheB/CheR fusion protein